jgi:molybdopterin converting factor small subunit
MKALEYLRKLIADYDKADKDWNVVDFAERYANQRVIEELEFQAKDLAENDSVDDAIADINTRIKQLKQER